MSLLIGSLQHGTINRLSSCHLNTHRKRDDRNGQCHCCQQLKYHNILAAYRDHLPLYRRIRALSRVEVSFRTRQGNCISSRILAILTGVPSTSSPWSSGWWKCGSTDRVQSCSAESPWAQSAHGASCGGSRQSSLSICRGRAVALIACRPCLYHTTIPQKGQERGLKSV